MDRTVARLNIEHFRRKLEEEADEAEREKLKKLLAAEQAKLQALTAERAQAARKS